MTGVFISYCRNDKDAVSTLAADFAELGYDVWIDQKLTGGQAWWDQILENIRDCDLFVISLSPHSLDSYACKLEWLYAHSLHKNILPVMVAGGVSTNLLPPELSTLQYIDYLNPDKQAAFALYKALNSLPEPQPLPEQLPDEPAVPVSYLGGLRKQIETAKELSFEEQSAILLQLKQGLSNQEDIDDLQELLSRFRKRDDLLARIAKEVDELSVTPDTGGTGREKHAVKPDTDRDLSVPATITIGTDTGEIVNVLKDTLSTKRSWVLKGPACLIEISQSNGNITAHAESYSWMNAFVFNTNQKTLQQQLWKLDYKHIILSFGIFFLVILTYGIALAVPKIRETMKTDKVSRTWAVVDDRQLNDLALDIVLAIKTIAPSCKTLTTTLKTT